MSEGAPDEHPMSIRSASDGERWKPAGEKGSTRVWKHVAMIFAVLVMSLANIGMAWGAVYKTYALSDLTYTSATLTYEVTGLSSNDQKLNKGERKVEVPCASASGTLYLSGTGANATRYASIWGSNGTAVDASRKIAMTSGYGSGISFTSADILTDGGKYYIIFSNVDGSDYKINAFKYVLSSACGGGASTKTIYMKAGAWNSDNPKYYVHSWGSSNSDVLMTAVGGCEASDLFKADIPSGNTSLLFTRQDPSSSGIKYKDESGNWNQSADITISTNDKFTFSAWDNGSGKSSFTSGNFAATTFTISFNGNGSTSGSTSSHTGIACNGSQTLRANGFTRTGWTFTGWNTSPYGDGTAYAAGATINSITSDIMLYAQWEKVMYMKSSMSWWYDASAWFAVWVANADESKQAWVAMTKAENCSDPEVYKATVPGNGYTKVVFVRKNPANMTLATWDNKWNQSSKESMPTSNNQFTITGGSDDNCTGSWGTYSAPTLTVTYNDNGSTGGSVPTDGSSPYACGSTVTVKGNTGSLVKTGYTFAGWNTDAGGGGTSYAASATFTISANTTLYAQWEEDASYSVTYNANGATGSVPTDANTYANGEEVTVLGKNTLAKTNYGFAGWRTAVSSGTWYVQGQTFEMGSANVNLYAQWVAEASMVSGTLYKAVDMKASAASATGQYRAGISANGIFEVLGVGVVDATTGPMEYGSDSRTIDGTAFTQALHFKGTGSGSPSGSTLPTARAIKFRVPAAGTLHLWVRAGSKIAIVKSGGSASAVGSSTDRTHETVAVTAGTYYLYATGTSVSLYGLQFVQSCTAPTGLTAASTTAKGTTFTITDGANTNDYEFYVVTSSGTPASNVTPTHTTTNKTLTITDCIAGTTYYAWVRSVCGVSNKSDWVALTGNTFTTSTVSADYHLSNVTKTSGATSGIGGSTFTAVFAAVSGYSLPSPVVTIGGNSATSGTDYTWTAGTGTLTINANKINGDIDITMSSPAAAPTNVAISGAYHYYPGETISLTATATGGNGPKTYQWYHGGTADGNAIDGATSATFTKSNCVVGDAGSYYCKVTCGGSASTWSDGAGHDPYNVKIMQFVLKNASGVTQSTTPLTKVDATHATVILHLTGGTTYKFRITDGCGNYFGNTGTMTNGNSTDWYMNADADCGMTTGLKTSNYTFNVTLGDLGNGMQVTAIYPGGDQAAGKIIYWDNSVLNWADGAQWYRIGKSTHHNKIQMTKVSGTANLYKVTTIEYNGFEYWHIANNQGNGDGNLFWTKGDAAKAITNAMEFEGAPVTLDVVTVTPTTSHATGETSDNDNCQFYTHTTVSGMKTDNVAITAPSNGTITVVYDDVAGDEQSFTSGNRDLAHTVILKSVTAAPATGYDLSSLTINGNTHISGNSYTCSGATTIAASFSLHNYNVTYSNPGNGNNYTIKVASGSASSESKTANMDQTITLVASPAAGYDFTGWTISKAGGGTVSPADASATTTTFTMPTDNVTITASFTLRTYTVNFAASPAGYGSVSPTSIASVNHGSTVSIASNVLTLKGTNVTATPTAAGADYTYAFSGWSVSNGAAITEAQTITANFTRTANQYSVTHSLTNMTTGSGATGANAATYGTDYTATLNANSGYSRPASITVTAGATDITANCTWNQSTGAVTIPGAYITGNITITAAAVLVYTVTFNSNGGSAVSPISQATTGAAITMPAAPTYADHTFQGWVIGGTTYAAGASYTPTANVTAYATWKADCAGGNAEVWFSSSNKNDAGEYFAAMSTSSNTTQLVGSGVAKLIAVGSSDLQADPSNKKVGYRLDSRLNIVFKFDATTSLDIYLTNGGASGRTCQLASFSSDKALSAIGTSDYSSKTTVTSNVSATGAVVSTVAAGSASVSSGVITITGSGGLKISYTSLPAGYYVFYSTSGSSMYVSGFEESSGSGTCYYVTYDGNGAESGSISDATAYASGANVTVLGNTGGNAFTKAGYEFTGWNTLANGTGTPYSAGGTISGISGNVTLFAQWGSPCSDPDDPTGLAVGSITSSGATFTITDAANTNNYEIVCKTTSGTPAADATPTQTGTSKTIAVTGLDAYTDYYAYVRSVCNASHKSSWVALTGAPFKTLCEDPTTAFANGDYTIGGSALDLRTLISGNNSSGAITYSVTNAGGTGATIAGDGYSFSATIPGTAYVRASQAANGSHCAVVLDATVTVAAANTCVTIAYFEETAHNNSSSKPDGAGKYLYGYDNSAKTEGYAYTLTTSTTDNKGQGTGASDYLRMNYGTTVNVYADNTTTGGTPESWSDVTSISVDFKMKNSSYYTTFDIKVGNTTIADDVSLAGDAQTGFTTFTYNNLANLDGKISIINNGSGSSNYHFYVDNIRICTSALTPCTTPVIPSLSDQTVCPGSDIAAWNATVSNAAAISAAGESVAYSWKKKGSDTELVNTASLDLGSSATEGQSGTYVVTVTVSADGKASASASKEVTLTVTPATETPSVTASKAKVYATDEVTLTATCGSTGVTWNWYLCANSDGTGAGSSLGTSATYTIASAPVAGTYYYKAVATGDGTNSCGTAEYVYTLVVSAANSCDKEFWFAKEADRPTGAAAATHITGCPSGSSSASYTASIDGTNYTLTGSTGQKTGNVTIVVPADNTGTLYVVVQGSSSRTITLSKGGTQIGQETPANSTWGVFTFDDLDAGTYTLVSSGNISWAMMALKLCPTAACTDDTPTAAATNATVCAGGSITITATGYEAGATFQWQKQNASTSVWEDIDDATSATYTVATAAAEHAGNYHIVATKTCARTSNTVTIAVPSAPVFNSFTTTRRIMETQALSISDVSATDAVSYTWYKSTDATWDAGDTEIGDSRSLLKPYDGEAAGSTYYVICRAANSCGTTTSTAITVTVQTLIEEDCAIAGNSGEHNTFAKTGNVSSGTYGSIAELHTNSNNKYIYYTAESGYYFATATVNACVGNASDLPTAAYSYSTDGGANWTDQNLTGMTTAYADHVINLPANVNAFRVGRRLGDCGTSSNTIYIHQVCFTYNENCTKTTVDPSSASVTHEIGDSFTEPTFTVKSSGVALSPQPTITYTSSDETVATVDDDGTVNFQDKAGTVVITAAYAGDATYCDSEGSYTITVSCSDEAPKIIAAAGTNIGGCNDEITLEAKKQDGTTNFSDGTYQWYRDGEAISGATGRTYTVSLTGVYSVERTSVGGCVSPSSNKATVTSESAEPEVERLTPFQYYHVDKVYAETSIMRFRHLFAVKNAGTTLEGKHFKMELSRNGGAATDVTNSNAFVMSADTVLLDMNKLYDKYEEDDELVLTCSAVDCEGNVSSIYKNTITIYVIDETPTLALICSGASGDGTRKTSNLVVGGDFLTGYNKADLCVQTGNTSFDKTQEWVLYTRLKENYIVTPVNGYAEFNKLNYEPFDILFLTDYPKASKSDAAATILDDMADLCDYRPLFTFKTHMVHKSPSKWAAKGFMAQPEVPKQSRLRLNIVCYAHPMFDDLKETSDHIQKDWNDHSQIVYTMLTGPGHEGSKGMQGFPIDAAEGFVTIGLVHYDATAADDTPSDGYVTWTPGSSDVMMVAAAERQVNLEARMILFSINCGAQSKLTETGRQVVLKSLEYLLSDATITPVADCSFTFTNGEGNSMSASEYASKCPACTGYKGDGKWSTAANWGPDWILQPGKDTEVKIAAPVTVDMPHAKVRTVRILEGGSIDIPAGSGLEVGSTIRRLDGTEISPTEVVDLSIGSTSSGNGTLIFNNNAGDTKAGVAMYSKGFIDYTDPSKPKGIKNYQYMGVPCVNINAAYNYYGSWIYSWSDKGGSYGWQKVVNGGIVTTWTGYCITQESAGTYYAISGTLAATGTVDIAVPAGNNMVVGNSWTAPIYIKEFTDDDFENLDGNVYFFNTGVDKSGDAGTAETRYQNSTYVTVPIHSSPYTGDSLISSMQGFFVKNTSGSDGVLHLDYDRHVRPSTNRNILSGEMHAPRRANAQSDEPAVLKIKVSGENYDDKLLLLAREDFSMGFDNGWDGDKWDGNESALYIYTKDEAGTENSVSAIPEMEGTVIGFRAGEDDAYTLHFEYLNSAEELYLFDTETNAYTKIMTGATYRFFTEDKEKHERFIITRKSPQIATDVDEVDSGKRREVRKLLIEDKMYILVNGMLYDATGKVVK